MNTEELAGLLPNGEYDPSEIILIGTHMKPWTHENEKKNRDTAYMKIASDYANKLKLVASPPSDKTPHGASADPALAVIYAYGYEGYSYRLPKPLIMIVNGSGEPFGSDSDNGPSSSTDAVLYKWHLSKNDKSVSIDVECDTLEKLILEGNQPGNRAVNSYAAHMQMSHRGGKLS